MDRKRDHGMDTGFLQVLQGLGALGPPAPANPDPES